MKITISDDDKIKLLVLARKVIEARASGGEAPSTEGLNETLASQEAGVFVSLHKQGQLRGCVGFTEPEKDIGKGVIRSAQSAAFQDTRFSPVSGSETQDLEIEISLLSPPAMVGSHDEIVLGRHGIIMEKSGRRALFLPQVPGEYGWDLATTLSHLSSKAGLPKDAWKEGAQFYVFESLAFSESED